MSKYENQNPLEKLHTDEPFFFLRAQDKFAPEAVEAYADELDTAEDFKGARECWDFAEIMRKWQRENPNKVKYPD